MTARVVRRKIARRCNPAPQTPCWRRLPARATKSRKAGCGSWPVRRPPPPRCRGAIRSLQQSYFDKQARLWAALASGKRETLASPEPGDRRFSAQGVARQPLLRLFEAVLSARRALRRGSGRSRPARPAGEEPRALRRAAVDRRDVPGQFPGDQSGRAARGGRRTRGESLTRGLRQPAGRRAASGRISMTDETRVRGRPQRRGHAGRGGVRERAVPADPVRRPRPRGRASGRW